MGEKKRRHIGLRRKSRRNILTRNAWSASTKVQNLAVSTLLLGITSLPIGSQLSAERDNRIIFIFQFIDSHAIQIVFTATPSVILHSGRSTPLLT